MKHLIQIQTFGGWGEIMPPAFAYDLSKIELWENARKTGLMRYGETGGEIRPIAPKFRTVFRSNWANIGAWSAVSGNIQHLRAVPSPFGGAAGLYHVLSSFPALHCFALAAALEQNESFAFRAFVHPVESGNTNNPKGHVWGVRIVSETKSGRGIAFQLRDGRPEILRLSKTWTRTQEQTLHLLYRLENPTSAEETQIFDLENALYSEVHSAQGADVGQEIFVTLIPDPAGNLHLAIPNEEIAAFSFPSLGKNPLWDHGAAVEVYATGGAWIFQPLGVRFAPVGKMVFGPFQNGFWADSWGQGVFSAQALANRKPNGEIAASVTFSRESLGETAFKFVADFSTTDNRYAAWLYGLSARLPNGPRAGVNVTEPSFDTQDLATDLEWLRDERAPVLECVFESSESGRRRATATLRDVRGATIHSAKGASIDAFVGRVCDLSVSTHRTGQSAPFVSAFRQGVITRATLHAARKYGGLATSHSKSETTFDLEIRDGWEILDTTLCEPSPVLDGLSLGRALRRLLERAGFTGGEMALVPANFGFTIERAAPGQAWANVPDAGSSIGGAVEALLERYGLGARFYQNAGGVWVLERIPTAVIASYTSAAAQNDREMLRGGTRDVVLDELVWERDHDNYYNVLRIEGGKNGEIVREWRDRHSMVLGSGGVAHPRWIGREKRYPTLRDTGLLSDGAVNYALRSLVFHHGQPGRVANFQSYFNRVFAQRDRVTVDGVLCEVLDWSASSAEDTMQIRVREIL